MTREGLGNGTKFTDIACVRTFIHSPWGMFIEGTTVSLLDCFSAPLSVLLAIQKRTRVNEDSIKYIQQNMEASLAESLNQALVNDKDPRHYDLARFAICACFDEFLMRFTTIGADHSNSLLQLRHYGTTNAGDEFFQYLAGLQDFESEVREIYYLCLSLGFQGRYAGEQQQRLLERLRDETYSKLMSRRHNPVSQLTGSYRKLKYIARGRLPFLAWVLVPLVLWMMHMTYGWWLDAESGHGAEIRNGEQP